MGYQQLGLNQGKQELVLPSTSIFWMGPCALGTVIKSGIDLNKNELFAGMEAVFYYQNESWINLLRGGMVTAGTPENHNFYPGGKELSGSRKNKIFKKYEIS